MQTISANPAAGTSHPCILIVDDVPANLGVLLDFLDGQQYEVLVAESGESALSQLAYARPDIILLDVAMPGIDGYETCRRLKADDRWRETPVLFLTALNDPVEKVRGFAVGAVDFISKPLHPEEVLARVRTHLQIRALQQELEERNELLQQAIALRTEAEAQLQQSLDRAVLVVRQRDEIQFCTRLARQLIDRYFPGEVDGRRLPRALAQWADGGTASRSWHADSENARLEVRLFAEGPVSGFFMLLVEETISSADSPAALLCPRADGAGSRGALLDRPRQDQPRDRFDPRRRIEHDQKARPEHPVETLCGNPSRGGPAGDGGAGVEGS